MKREFVAFGIIGLFLLTVPGCTTIKIEQNSSYKTGTAISRYKNFDNTQNPRLVVQTGHAVWVDAVAFNPDGQIMASSCRNNYTIKLWDIRTGRNVFTLPAHRFGVTTMAFSPNGQLLASGGVDFPIKIWDVRTRKILRTLTGHSGSISSVVFSPDGHLLASGSVDATIRLWEVHTGRELFTLKGHKHGINAVVFSPDGQLLASGGVDTTIRLWNVHTGRELFTLNGNKHGVNDVAFSSNGLFLASSSKDDHIIKLWDVRTGTMLRAFTGHSDGVLSVTFSPDGQLLASGSNDHTIRLWNVQTGKMLCTLTGYSPINCVVFSPDGHILASGGHDTQIKLWDVHNGKEFASLIAIDKRDWAVVMPNGLFDASPGAMQWIHWVIDLKPIDFYQLKDHYYEPGLLSKLLGFRDGPLRKVSPLAHSKMYPDIEFLATDSFDPIIRLRLINRGGGIGRVVIFLNGKEIIADARDKNAHPQAQQMELSIDLSRYPVFMPQEQNTIEVKAYNTEGSLSSWGIRRTYEPLSILPDAQEPELVVQTGHSGRVNSVAFSPDGQLVASGSDDHSIRLWDVRTGKLLRTLTGHAGRVYSVVFSPDGQLLASGSKDTTVKLWDVRTGRELLILTGHSVRYCEGFWLYSVAFSPEGQILASSDDQAIRLWDVQTGKLLRTFPEGSHSITFSPDGQIIASDSGKLWDIHTGKILRTLTGNLPWGGYFVAFIPNGQFLAGGSLDGSLGLWDVQTGTMFRTLTKHSGRLYSVAFSQDGQFLAGSSEDQTIRLWNVRTGTILRTFTGHSGEVYSVTFSPDGQILASGSTDTTVKLWDVHTGKLLRTLTGYSRQVYSVAFSSDRQILASSEDHSIRLWDIHTGKLLRTLTDHSGRIYSMAFSPKEQLLASSEDHIIKLWDIQTGKLLRTFIGHSGEVYSVTFSPNGEFLASGGIDNVVKLWDMHTGGVLRTFTGNSQKSKGFRQPSWGIYSVAFSPDEQIIAGSGLDGSLRIWDIRTGKELRTLTGHSGRIHSVAFSPDGKFLVGGSSDRILRLWDVWTGTVVHSFIGHSDNVGSVAFSPDGQFIASGSDDHTIRLWDARSGTIMHTLTGHSDNIRSVAFSPDGRLLASASLDGSFKLWDVRNAMELAAFAAIDRTDYIIATPDHYYTAVKEGLKGIAFRVGNNVFPFEQFDLRLNRPDIVLHNLGFAPRELIETYHNVYQKRLRRMNFTEEMLGDDFHLPEIEILTKDLPLSTVDKYLTFTIRAADSKYFLDRIHVYVNNVPIYGIRGITLRDKHTFEHEQDITLELSNGRNKIQVSVLNQQGTESLKETVEVEYTGTPVSPELYIIAVGVSEYAETNRNLKYAAKDGIDIVTFFQQHRQNFNQVHVQKLLNTEATKENILAVKEWLKQTKVDDQVTLFFAGHGLLDEQFDYYFATTDVNFDHPSKRGLLYEEIEGLLDGIPARKKLLFMDTCHSGEVDKEEVQLVATANTSVEEKGVTSRSFRGLKRLREKSLGLQNSFELLRELFANLQRGSGAIVISAASGLEFAYEARRYQNGLFTHALLEGLQGQADANADQVIQVSELRDYVTAKVRKLTHNRQTPTIRRENVEFDFQVAYTTQGNDIHPEGQATEPIPEGSLTGEELSATDRDDANTLFTGTFKYVQDVNNRNVVHILKLVQTDQVIKGNLELTLDDSYYRCCQTTATSSVTGKAIGTSATITFSGGYTSCPCGVGKAWGDEDGDYDSISYSISSGYTVTYTLENDGKILREHCDTIKGCPRRCTIELAGVPQRQYCHRLCPWDYFRQ